MVSGHRGEVGDTRRWFWGTLRRVWGFRGWFGVPGGGFGAPGGGFRAPGGGFGMLGCGF